MRIYLLSGTEHPTAAPHACRLPTNPHEKVRTLRALTVALEKRVLEGEAPLDSPHPSPLSSSKLRSLAAGR